MDVAVFTVFAAAYESRCRDFLRCGAERVAVSLSTAAGSSLPILRSATFDLAAASCPFYAFSLSVSRLLAGCALLAVSTVLPVSKHLAQRSVLLSGRW
jgi:hypothetical protein